MRDKITDKKYTVDDEFYYSNIRRKIKKYRLENNLTQQELANMNEILGMLKLEDLK